MPVEIAVEIRLDTRLLRRPLQISSQRFESIDFLQVVLRAGDIEGIGEAAGVYYRSDDVNRMRSQIDAVRPDIERGIDRQALRSLLPPGGARNAIDCALWELEARIGGCSVVALSGVPVVRPLQSTFTLGAGDPAILGNEAREWPSAKALKLKLSGDGLDAARIAAVRKARPDVWLGVDANQGLDRPGLDRLMPEFLANRVSLVEQPLPVGHEAELDGLKSIIPIAADESVQGLEDVAGLVGRFDVVNIKLDKCGGLTEGLMMANEARRLGLKVMVGNMLGTSIAMAPAFILGQLCDFVDLDGSFLLTEDVEPGMRTDGGMIWCGDDVWGSGRPLSMTYNEAVA